jgi:hypothetical protein
MFQKANGSSAFREMIVCGEGEFVTTFLRIGQVAEGEEVL